MKLTKKPQDGDIMIYVDKKFHEEGKNHGQSRLYNEIFDITGSSI